MVRDIGLGTNFCSTFLNAEANEGLLALFLVMMVAFYVLSGFVALIRSEEHTSELQSH